MCPMGDAKDPEQTAVEVGPVYVMDIHKTSRSLSLRALQAYLLQRQHDHKTLSWDGAPRDAGVGYMYERLQPQGFVPSNAAPYGYSGRKPSCPDPIGRQVIRAFTDMVFGASPPDIGTPADPATGSYLESVMAEADAWDTLSEVRDYTGACGESAILVEVLDGEPSTERLNTANLEVLEWETCRGWIPKKVVEQRIVEKSVLNEETKKSEVVKVIRTRYWDDQVAVTYEDVPTDYGQDEKDPKPIPVKDTVEHNAGRCPIVWVQSTRSSQSTSGDTDLEGVYEVADQIDKMQSMVTRASVANTDPTLVYKDEDRNRRRNNQLRKGHGARIDVGPQGDAKLLETTGSSIQTSWDGVRELRERVFQVTGCVVVTPETASAYKSGTAIAMMWRAMESRCSTRLRPPLKTAIKQICNIYIAIGTAVGVSSMEEDEPGGIVLPPKVTPPSKDDPDTPPKIEAHKVGRAKYYEVRWAPFHEPTPEGLQAMAAALTAANGQKPLLSRETATREMVNVIGNVDPNEELERIEAEHGQSMSEFDSIIGVGSPGDDGKEEGEDDTKPSELDDSDHDADGSNPDDFSEPDKE